MTCQFNLLSDFLMQTFDEQALLVLIQQLIKIESRWIPSVPDHSLYIRPTFIGTRPGKQSLQR